MVTMRVMKVPIMKIVGVVAMLDRSMPTVWAMNVVVIRVFVAICAHVSLLDYCLCGRRRLKRDLFTFSTLHQLYKCLTPKKTGFSLQATKFNKNKALKS